MEALLYPSLPPSLLPFFFTSLHITPLSFSSLLSYFFLPLVFPSFISILFTPSFHHIFSFCPTIHPLPSSISYLHPFLPLNNLPIYVSFLSISLYPPSLCFLFPTFPLSIFFPSILPSLTLPHLPSSAASVSPHCFPFFPLPPALCLVPCANITNYTHTIMSYADP